MGNTTAAAAGTWELGDLVVNRVGFGAMRLPQAGRPFEAGAVPRDRALAIEVLRRAVGLGVNHIDTAAFYFSSYRSANELINSALAPYPDGLVIVTKVGPGRNPSGEWLPTARPDQLRGQVEENLRQLGRDHLDVVNLRVRKDMASLAEHFGVLAELRRAGLVRHLGVSGVTPQQLAEAQGIAPVVCVQNRYFIGESAQAHEFVDACGEQGIAFVPYFTIAGEGRHAGATGTDHAEVLTVARAHGATAAQVCLAWTLHRGRHVLAIPGTGDPAHLAANVAAGALRLTHDEVARLTSVAA
ncbi:MAG TPA: oxidoreductase [Streptosporangiaceae bacterium]|nr:oxidoreductase [Streptosporangiaceae bacterium]